MFVIRKSEASDSPQVQMELKRRVFGLVRRYTVGE
jgi:hypothetical protein